MSSSSFSFFLLFSIKNPSRKSSLLIRYLSLKIIPHRIKMAVSDAMKIDQKIRHSSPKFQLEYPSLLSHSPWLVSPSGEAIAKRPVQRMHFHSVVRWSSRKAICVQRGGARRRGEREGRRSVHESSYRETRDKGSVHQVLLRSQWPWLRSAGT